MRISLLLPVLLLFFTSLQAQKIENYDVPEKTETTCVTIGIFQGGGSLVGVDIEFLIANRFGIQGGAGFLGYGAGLNYHFKPELRSSFLSLVYWHQGVGNTYTQSIVGPTIVYRSKKWFTAQFGIGQRVGEGPALPESIKDTKVMLLYSIGAYIAQ
ncbi:MAG: hypothetical protein ACXWEY_16355 [Bacteroidia bacterium]